MKPVRVAFVIAIISAAIGLSGCNKPAGGPMPGASSDAGALLKS